MAGLKASLFGKFRIERGDQQLVGIDASKAQELLSLLFIHRDRPQTRESLSEILWRDQPPATSRKNLRQTLWKLKTVLEVQTREEPAPLLVDSDWIQLNPSAHWWLDIAEFEQTFGSIKNVSAREINPQDYRNVEQAADLYQGDLLEGWYQDWSIFERERYRSMYLTLLTRLVQYCELNRKFEAGLDYGEKLLQHDRAYEKAHRQMMRLYFLSGDRTRALRQYNRCAAALQEELGVDPSDRTIQLYEQIKAGRLRPPDPASKKADGRRSSLMLKGAVEHLDQFLDTLTHFRSQIQKDIMTDDNLPY
ncbi:MAG: BTAD domain-containing putative transcriptional regulator [Anaerolineales bacterium]|jgi:DNA-binding SARP family transcriptional activator